MSRATLSVAMATYNGEAFLAEQLASLAAQTRLPDELVVRDDASTDGTLAVLSAFAERSPFPVRIVAGAENLGYARNFGEALGLCSGELIALADQDDVWLPHKLALLEAVLAAEPGALLAFSDLEVVDEELRPLGRTMWGDLRLGPAAQERFRMGWRASPLLADYYVTGASVLLRARLLETALPIELPGYHDAWLALLAAMTGRVIPVPEPLLLYRQHGHNQLGAPPEEGFWAATQRRVLRWGEGDRVIAELAVQRLDLMRAVRARLDKWGMLSTVQREVLDEAISHLTFRASIPPYPGRALWLAQELVSGRYHALSDGWRTALRDSLRAPALPRA